MLIEVCELEKILTTRSTVVAVKEQVSCNLADEAVILDLKAGVYYGLNVVGMRIWALLQEPKTVSEIRAAIFGEYDVDVDRCQHDLLALLLDLEAKKLIRVSDDASA